MTTSVSTEAFIQHLEELRKISEFERTRNYLKPFVIGFFIGRKNKKKITEVGRARRRIFLVKI